MFQEHEDYANYNEFGPENPEIPEEYLYCLFCVYHDVAAPPRRVCTALGDELLCRPCLAVPSRLVEEETPAAGCRQFTPTNAALSGARAAALCYGDERRRVLQ